MSLLKVKATVDKNGVLTAKLPPGTAEATVDVLINWPLKGYEAQTRFMQVLTDSFGSIPNMVRPDQGELPPPKNW